MFAIYHNLTYTVDTNLAGRIVGPFETEDGAIAACVELVKRFDPEGYDEAQYATAREVDEATEEGETVTETQRTRQILYAYQEMLSGWDFLHVFRMETFDTLVAHLEQQQRKQAAAGC